MLMVAISALEILMPRRYCEPSMSQVTVSPVSVVVAAIR